MKNGPFSFRVSNALRGIACAWKTESSFRAQIFCGAIALLVLLAFRPEPLWWCVFALAAAGTWAMELVNTALEMTIDRLHPAVHPSIRQAKDCAAGAVLVMSIATLVVFLFFIHTRIS